MQLLKPLMEGSDLLARLSPMLVFNATMILTHGQFFVHQDWVSFFFFSSQSIAFGDTQNTPSQLINLVMAEAMSSVCKCDKVFIF